MIIINAGQAAAGGNTKGALHSQEVKLKKGGKGGFTFSPFSTAGYPTVATLSSKGAAEKDGEGKGEDTGESSFQGWLGWELGQ